MRKSRFILWFSVWITCHCMVHGGEVARPANTSATSSSTISLQELYASWKNRRSRASAVECEWGMVGQLRSSGFRVNLNKKMDVTGDPIHVIWNGNSLHVKGRCEPAIHLGSDFVPDGSWVTRTSQLEFTGVLNSRLDEQTVRSPEQLPYALEIDVAREIHAWTTTRRKTPCIAMLPAGFSGLMLDYDATNTARLPALWALAEALRLACCPDFLLDERAWREKAKKLPDRPVVGGQECDAFEYPLDMFPGHRLVCRLWVDRSPDRRVARAILGSANSPIVQYDFNYGDESSNRHVPQRVVVMQLNTQGDPHDELCFVRMALRANPAISPGPSLGSPPAGALVVDRIAGRAYRVANDGTQQPASMSEVANEFGIDVDLTSIDPSMDSWQQFSTNILLKMITWPWIVLTSIALCGAWLCGRALARRLRRAGKSAAVVQNAAMS